jgi:uncharacterized membrane protein
MARVPTDHDIDVADDAERGAAGEFPDFGDAQSQSDYDDDDFPVSLPSRSARVPAVIALLAALAGLLLAGRSTSDFVAHLDRQVHGISCSVSIGAEAEMGESGCRAVMLSPYSSWFREDLWGGMPVSLLAMAVFAFLMYRSAHLVVRGPKATRTDAGFHLAAWGLPVLMSIIFGYIALKEVGATCVVCVGMYVSSGIGLVAGLAAFLLTSPAPIRDTKAPAKLALSFGEGCAFVGLFTLFYLGAVPDGEAAGRPGAKGCGSLVEPGDPAGIMVPISTTPGGVPSVELLDPLCPACKAFDERLHLTGLDAKLDQKAVLFPLDSTCNWMVSESLHPGACAITEAMLCVPPNQAPAVLQWAFEHQEALMAEAKTNEAALRARIQQQFPATATCLGSAQVKNRVVKSLRWAVTNALPVMTPQLYVKGTRLCDEDTDLGLQYTLGRMIGVQGGGRRR